MDKGIVKRLKGNYRYCVIYCCGSDTYLLDTDKLWLGYIFPVFNYKIPNKVMKLKQDFPEYLIVREGENKKVGKSFWSGFIGLMVFQHFLFIPLLNALSSRIVLNQNLLILLITTIIIILLKSGLSMTSQKKLRNYVDWKNIETRKLFVRPISTKVFSTALILPLVFIGFTAVGAYTYLVYDGHIVSLFIFSTFGFCITMMNWLIYPYTECDLSDYYIVKFIEDND